LEGEGNLGGSWRGKAAQEGRRRGSDFFPHSSFEQLFLGDLGDSEHALSSCLLDYIISPLSFTFWS